MKYIIFKQLGEEVPVLFPSTIQHSKMAALVADLMKPVSAGFIRPYYNGTALVCYGDSMTLNIKSRPQDTEIVNTFLGL